MKKEITGYIAPIDLWEGSVKKGDVCRRIINNTSDYTFDDACCFRIPKEITEQWEPAYLKQKTAIIKTEDGKFLRLKKGDPFWYMDLRLPDPKPMIEKWDKSMSPSRNPRIKIFSCSQVAKEYYEMLCNTFGFYVASLKK